jgi:thiamine phosphate synthase YjbQ (UPF0047 family)
MQTVFDIRTSGAGLHEFTDEVVRFVRDSGVREGLLTLFVQHTSTRPRDRTTCRRTSRRR